jgi:ribosome-associated protein
MAAEAIEVSPDVRVPSSAIGVKAVRSSGPGGQNVNKVSSRIELTVALRLVEGLDEPTLARLFRLSGRRVDASGTLRVTASESRDRSRNLLTAREKVRALVAAALVAPKPRRATRPHPGAREKRLGEKKRDARVKSLRRASGDED